MSLNMEAKKALVAEVSAALADSQAAVLAEYRGLSVAQMTELRARARDNGIYLRVVKNTLTRRAVQGTDYACLDRQLVGPLALAASADPVAVAKVLREFAKTNEQLVITGGAMGGKSLSVADLDALARLPGRNELLAMLVGTMQAPIQKFVRTLNEVPARFVRTLAAVRDSKAAA